ncbi:hypothetical protein LVD15_18930 [Fulvivirga maritima]|uniref:DUF6850 family outer membrane beta-barrel protein n=1 Tax=Fulvivirga maritima TaxID=2904247 RepID=UPI001F1D012E|nr:DUF6850 family outer membrane beta-barrel protein [Fulvivirga maritima]UII25361.1 hypothetical protein LVD15_18930 [Fulvivirga maritima]
MDNQLLQSVLQNDYANQQNLLFLPINDYTASSLYYNYEDGDLRAGAIPENIQQVGLTTTGLYHSKQNILFYGKFKAEKEYYQNLKWDLNGELYHRGLMPTHQFMTAEKGSDWSNQNYELSGGMIIPTKNNRWAFSVNGDFKVTNRFRSEYDPRSKVTNNSIVLDLGASYKLSETSYIKAAGTYGFSHFRNNIKYSNASNNIPYSHDTYIKWMAGYGTLLNYGGSNSPNSGMTASLSGFNIGYTFQNKTNLIIADIIFANKSEETFDISDINPSEKDPVSSYSPTTWRLNTLWLHHASTDKLLKLGLDLSQFDATNFLFDKGGKNYNAKEKEVKLDLGYFRQHDNITQWELNAQINLWQVTQQDVLSTTKSELSKLEASVSGSKTFPINENLNIQPSLAAQISTSINSTFFNGNENYLSNIKEDDYLGQSLKAYYNQIIYHDVDLYSTNTGSLKAGTSFNFYKESDLKTSIKLHLSYSKALERIAFSSNDKAHRLFGSVSLNFYY